MLFESIIFTFASNGPVKNVFYTSSFSWYLSSDVLAFNNDVIYSSKYICISKRCAQFLPVPCWITFIPEHIHVKNCKNDIATRSLWKGSVDLTYSLSIKILNDNNFLNEWMNCVTSNWYKTLDSILCYFLFCKSF